MDVMRRQAVNERLMREVNVRIARVAEGLAVGDGAEPVEILCECVGISCFERIAIDLTTYASVRKMPRRYVVRPGHMAAESEEVVESHGEYHVVETKLGD
jgi:hypothetical protein